jgi:hypothetical protein
MDGGIWGGNFRGVGLQRPVIHRHTPFFPQVIHRISTVAFSHKLVVINDSQGETNRVRVVSDHESMHDLLECRLCRRLLAAGFRIDLKNDPYPASNRIRGEFGIEN